MSLYRIEHGPALAATVNRIQRRGFCHFADATERGQQLPAPEVGAVSVIDTSFDYWNGTAWTPLTGASSSPLDAWPIGAVYIGITATNPAGLLGGGTWTEFGRGRMLIGADPADTAMDTAEETGGAKTITLATANLPAHNHPMPHTHDHPHTHNLAGRASATAFGTSHLARGNAAGVTDVVTLTANDPTTGQPSNTTTSNTGSGTAINNLPPYIAVYMWKRTA